MQLSEGLQEFGGWLLVWGYPTQQSLGRRLWKHIPTRKHSLANVKASVFLASPMFTSTFWGVVCLNQGPTCQRKASGYKGATPEAVCADLEAAGRATLADLIVLSMCSQSHQADGNPETDTSTFGLGDNLPSLSPQGLQLPQKLQWVLRQRRTKPLLYMLLLKP